jgi:hypothetical protein
MQTEQDATIETDVNKWLSEECGTSWTPFRLDMWPLIAEQLLTHPRYGALPQCRCPPLQKVAVLYARALAGTPPEPNEWAMAENDCHAVLIQVNAPASARDELPVWLGWHASMCSNADSRKSRLAQHMIGSIHMAACVYAARNGSVPPVVAPNCDSKDYLEHLRHTLHMIQRLDGHGRAIPSMEF